MAEKKAKTEPRPEYRPRPQTLLKYVRQAVDDAGLGDENSIGDLFNDLEQAIVERAVNPKK